MISKHLTKPEVAIEANVILLGDGRLRDKSLLDSTYSSFQYYEIL